MRLERSFLFGFGLGMVFNNIFYSILVANEIEIKFPNNFVLPTWIPLVSFIFSLLSTLFFLYLIKVEAKKYHDRGLLKTLLLPLKYLKGMFFVLSIAGAFTAIKYTQTGTLISISGAIEEKVIEKVESYVNKKINGGDEEDIELEGRVGRMV